MLVFAKIFQFIIDPKNRTIILFIIIGLLVALFFYQRSRTEHFKYKFEEQVLETLRVTNNWAASKDSVKNLIDEKGRLVGTISGYQLTVEELTGNYDSIFRLYDYEKDKPPEVIIEYETLIIDNIRDLTTTVKGDTIEFYDSTHFSGDDYRTISGKIPYSLTYHIKQDSTNSFTLNRATLSAYRLQRQGIKDAFVVAYKGSDRISIQQSLIENDSLIYRIQIYASSRNRSVEEVATMFELDKDYIYRVFENGKYKYMTGSFVPKRNIMPVIDLSELYTEATLNTENGFATFTQRMALNTFLYKDKKTGKIMIEVKTAYPGVTFTKIVGADIMSNENNRKLVRGFRKEFGVGLHLGYGGMLVPVNSTYQFKHGPVMSIGLNWSPRFLQFGPSQTSKSKNLLDKLD